MKGEGRAVREAAAILAVLLIAASFRLVRIASHPPGLFQDEAVNGVNVYTILGGSPRFYFGEREPLFMYLSALVSLMLGTTPLALRVTAAFVGIFNAAAVGALGRQLFGRTVGLLAAAGVATSLWLTVLSRVSFRATMVPGVECLGLALLWRGTRTGNRRDFAIGGAVLGLTLYTYLAARFIPFALVAFAALCLVFQRVWLRKILSGLAVAGLAAVVVCLPLGVYALRHPDVVFGRPDQVVLPTGAAFLPALIDSTVRTLGMLLVRGDPTWRHNFGGMPVFDAVDGVVFLLGLVVALRRHRPSDLLSIVFAFVMLAPGMLSIDSPHYLRTVGAAGAIYVLWAVGVAEIVEGTRWTVVGTSFPFSTATAGALVMVFFVSIAGARTAWDYFVVYPQRPEVAAYFNADLAAAGRFLATSDLWHGSRTNVYVTDRYQTDRSSVTYFLYPYLSADERARWLDEANVGTFFPQDELIPLPIAPSLYLVSGRAELTLAALGNTVTRTQWVRQGDDRDVLAVWAQPAKRPADAAIAQFGQTLILEDSRIQPSASAPAADADGARTLVLRWKVSGKPTFQPSLFVHVDDSRGHTLAQADQEMRVPVARWQPGQELVTIHAIRLPAGIPPGTYTLSVGVYDKPSGNRETASASGHPVANVVALALELTRPVGGDVAPPARRVDAAVAPGLTLLGGDAIQAEVEAGAAIPVTALWRSDGLTRADYVALIALTSGDGSVVGEWREPVGGSNFPTGRWPEGTVIRQTFDVPVAATAGGPVVVSVAVMPTDPASSDVGGSASIDLGRTTVKASTHQFYPPVPGQRLDIAFSDAGRLIGYDVGPTTPHPGEPLHLALYWQASGQSGSAYTVFVHALDAQNQVVGQRDEPPDHGNRPTTGWVAGEYVADPHELSVAPGTPAGSYRIEVGLYDARTGQRVVVAGGSDSTIIGSVEVRPP